MDDYSTGDTEGFDIQHFLDAVEQDDSTVGSLDELIYGAGPFSMLGWAWNRYEEVRERPAIVCDAAGTRYVLFDPLTRTTTEITEDEYEQYTQQFK